MESPSNPQKNATESAPLEGPVEPVSSTSSTEPSTSGSTPSTSGSMPSVSEVEEDQKIPENPDATITVQGGTLPYIHTLPGPQVAPSQCTCSLALVSRITGQPVILTILHALPQLETGENLETACREVFQFQEWPAQLVGAGVCPARELISQHKDAARLVQFRVGASGTEEPPEETSANADGTPNFWDILRDLHQKGFAMVVHLAPNSHNILFIVSYNGRPMGILIPKTQFAPSSSSQK